MFKGSPILTRQPNNRDSLSLDGACSYILGKFAWQLKEERAAC